MKRIRFRILALHPSRHTLHQTNLGLRKELTERHLEARQKRGREAVVRFLRKSRGSDIPQVGQSIDFDALQFLVHDPVFTRPVSFVEFTLDHLVDFPGAGGEDFDDKIRRPLNVLLRDDGRTGGGDEEQGGKRPSRRA